MKYAICFYQYSQNTFYQYPLYDGIENIAIDTIKRVRELRGKQQLIIRRSGENGNYAFILYNYTLNKSRDAFGICLLFQKYYPQNTDYIFSLFGKTLSEILKEGKILFFDPKSKIRIGDKTLHKYDTLMDVHLDKLTSLFKEQEFCFATFSTNYYEIYQNETGIYQLSDNSWSVSEAFKTKNIIIITNEIEDENINSMRSFIIKSNETIDDLNRQIKNLEEQLKKAEREKKRQSQTNTLPKQGSSMSNHEMEAGTWVILGGIGAIILLNVIAPWFIPSMWVKFTIVLTCLGIYFSLKALNDGTNNKISKVFGWSGVIAIFLSTILTIYGLCGGLSPDTIDESENTQAVTEGTIVQDNESEHHVSKPTPVTHIPNKFVHISSGTSDFYIDRYEVTQKDYVALMGNNPSKFQGDSLPVHGMSVRDAMIYCNKKSDAEGLRGFYDISGNVVTLKSDGNGYRLPTEKEWILAARDPKKNMKNNENIYHSQQSLKIRKNSDFKPHVAGKNNSNGWGLYDMYGNVCELCVRDNGEIWGKGGSYRIVLDSETSENGGLKAAEDLSSTINLNADFGLRLVFIP